MKKVSLLLVSLLVLSLAISACGSSSGAGNSSSTASSVATSTVASSQSSSSKADTQASAKLDLADGTYSCKFTTDSSMLKINPELKNEASLTVKDGKATAHCVLSGTGYLKLFLGSKEDAPNKESEHISYTEESLKYSDGTTDKVYAFDIPVPVIDEEYAIATVGKKGTWYDHKVKVSEVKKK